MKRKDTQKIKYIFLVEREKEGGIIGQVREMIFALKLFLFI